ncbi:unnamed protein product [Prunus armeniaca]
MPCPELLQDSHFRKIGLGGGRPGARRQPRRISTTKDSVMVVTKDEYEKCHSAQPIFFSNNGVTVFTLDRPGLFNFISGVSGHCERGQKIIIKVLEPASPPQSADQNKQKNDAAVAMAAITSATLMSCIMSNLWGSFSSNCSDQQWLL